MNERVLAGRFRLTRLLGRGGMAEVYAAWDANLEREVAIKVLLPRFADDEDFQERFTSEGRRAAGLNHPNIVTVLDTGIDQATGLRFIVMELVEGRSLQEAIRAGGLTEQRALEAAADVAAALEYAHERGLVHRDIKPGNILLADDGTVKVTDFGIARAIDSDSNVTQTAAVLGTAAYLSPEQAQGRPVDARSDIYSLGVVLYELLTGQQPFQGDTPVTVAYQHVQEIARPPRDLNPGLSTPAEAIVMRALAKNPANRYATAGDLRDDLLHAMAGQGVSAPAVLRAEDTALLDPVSPDRAATGARAERRRRIIGYTLLGVASVAAAALAVFLLLSSLGGSETVRRIVPDVLNMTVDQAEQVLADRGLNGIVIDNVPSGDVEAGRIARQDPAANDRVADGATVRLYVSSGPERVDVPEVAGLEESAAVAMLRDAGLTPGERIDEFDEEVEEGIVLGTEPSIGTRVDAGTTIDLIVSAGQELVRVRSVTLEPEARAKLALEEQGFEVLTVQEFSDSVDAGFVIRQEPGAGTELERGEEVTIVVSKGPEETAEPTPTETSPTPTESPTPSASPTPSDSPAPEPSPSVTLETPPDAG